MCVGVWVDGWRDKGVCVCVWKREGGVNNTAVVVVVVVDMMG